MREIKNWVSVLFLGACLLVATGFSKPAKPAATPGTMEGLARYMAVLKSGTAQQKAEAAYKISRQHASPVEAIPPLVELLGDTTTIDPTTYRRTTREHRPTLGEEVAVALVHIGSPAVEPLIRVLKTSPSAEARKNAAWALGALHDTGADNPSV